MEVQSEKINELVLALSKAQIEFKPVKKEKINPFFGSKYADLPAILESCSEALHKNQLTVIQGPWPSGDGTYMLLTTLSHSSGQWMRSLAPLIAQKPNSQGIGSAITYMKRYCLSAVLGICAEDEDDDGEKAMGDRKGSSQALKATPIKSGGGKKISNINLQEIEQLINGHDDIRQRMCKWIKKEFDGKSLKDIPQIHFEKTKLDCQQAIEKKYKNAKEGEVKNERAS